MITIEKAMEILVERSTKKQVDELYKLDTFELRDIIYIASGYILMMKEKYKIGLEMEEIPA